MSVDTKEAIILFTRIPVPGKTKTRLMPCYTPLECAKLHGYFLKDIMEECQKLGKDIYICYDPDGNVNVLKKLLGKEQNYFEQRGAEIGSRMENALKEILAKGYEKCLLFGADVPELTAKQLQRGLQELDQSDVVLGPTTDGGYYLIGAKAVISEAFHGIEYGVDGVAVATKSKLEDAGYEVSYVDTLSDIDTPQDLLEYRKRKPQNYTGRYLERTPKISVIIPIYNERTTIHKIQDELDKLKDCEIIFVDGGSTDGAPELLDKKYRVVRSEKGRANQMNKGAQMSAGNVLFFLHCDSQLPKQPAEEIKQVMKTHTWGCFGIAFHSYRIDLLVCRIVSNHRIKDRKVVFGDQGIFIERDLFFEIGMYPGIPIMEDYQFSLTLKERKEKIGMTKHRIYTSPRRFEGGLVNRVRIMWKMNRLRAMYREGVDINHIAQLYRDIR